MEEKEKMVLYPYPSTEQFANVIRAVKLKTHFVGLDADGQPMYDGTRLLPVLHYTGTVKLHGTNATIHRFKVDENSDSQFYAQSRAQVLNPPYNDNAGFGAYMKALPQDIINRIFKHPHTKVTVCGEWAGKSIQNGVGISRVEKSFFIFGASLHIDGKEHRQWINVKDLYSDDDLTAMNAHRVYSIYQFQTWEIDIDFNNPQLIQNQLVSITEQVGTCCPVAKALGVEGEPMIGEGVVWKTYEPGFESDDFWYKVKDERHSASKIRRLASVDVEKLNSVKEFIEYAVTENRLKQGLENIPGLDMRYTGDFIRWVFNDVMKEETLTLEENKIDQKLIGSEVAKVAKRWFFERIKAESGL